MNKEIYLRIIKDALPKAMIEYVSNFDDINSGFLIVPAPGELITFRMGMADGMWVVVSRSSLIGYNYGEVKYREIFRGQIPANKKGDEPDFDLIESILRNYRLFKL
jgi:hypothetical protein